MMAGFKVVVVWWLTMGGRVAAVYIPRRELQLSQRPQAASYLDTTAFQAENVCETEPCCPYPYMQVLDECFYVSNKTLSWTEARQYCLRMQGDLATPKHVYALVSFINNIKGPTPLWIGGTDKGSEGVWQWVDGRPIITDEWSVGNPSDNYGPTPLWIGGTDKGSEGVWQWVDGRPIITDEWSVGNPSDNYGNENCMDLIPELHPSLNDNDCNRNLSFICQY
ncbi:C-type lectin lectoxin-Phi1-like [Procambarus clarkii]|uniref:C-type lectin lectoxin-Phi1-like n=1 Tax=Procambarus clarkii TaxID=6728 RepID=UPI0037420A6D